MSLPQMSLPELLSGKGACTKQAPVSPEGGELSAKTKQILSTAKKLEDEVSRLKGEADKLRVEQQRWNEFQKVGIPKRESAAADFAFEKAREADKQEKKARDAEHMASNEKRAMETAGREGAESKRKAEEAAKRAEEQLAAAQKSFSEWRDSADAAAAEMRSRHLQANSQLEARLAKAEEEAENHSREHADYLDATRNIAKSEIDQEMAKISRQRLVLQTRGEERRNRSQVRVQCAEASAAAAEAKRDRQVDHAVTRWERSRCAAESKVHLASLSQDSAVTKTSMRLDQANRERDMRLEAARAREAVAVRDLERRVSAAEEQIAVLKSEKAKTCEECAQVEEQYRSMVDRHCQDLRSKIRDWTVLAEETEAAGRQKVRDVRALAERLKNKMLEEVRAVEVGVNAEAEAVRSRDNAHENFIQGTIKHKQKKTEEVMEHASNRMATVDQLTQLQLTEVEKRNTITVDQAKKEFDCTKDIMDGRVQKAVSHLMNYLEDRETDEADANGLSLELWVTLPGTPEVL